MELITHNNEKRQINAKVIYPYIFYYTKQALIYKYKTGTYDMRI